VWSVRQTVDGSYSVFLARAPFRSHTLPPASLAAGRGGIFGSAIHGALPRKSMVAHEILLVHRSQPTSLESTRGVSGGSGVDDRGGLLLLSVRSRLERGVLVLRHRVWAGKGTGQICAVCEQTIHADEVENEVAINGGGVTVKLYAHAVCLSIWQRATEVYRDQHGSSFAESRDGGEPI